MAEPQTHDPLVKKDIDDNKLIAAIGYIGILCLVPLLLKRDSAYAQFHGKQGLMLVIGWVINFMIGIIPLLGWVLSFFGTAALVILSIIGILKALAGEYWEMPYLGEYAKRLKV